MQGKGKFTPPAFGPKDLADIIVRADQVQDQQLKTDLFRLFTEVQRLWAIRDGTAAKLEAEVK